jgi:hypothetical protein
MSVRISLPAPFDSGPFSVRAANEAGIGRGRLRGRDLEHPFWGVRVPPKKPSPTAVNPLGEDELADAVTEGQTAALCGAYSVRMAADQFFSHVTAARLYGVPLPARFRLDTMLDVSVPSPTRAVRAAGIRGHKLRVEESDRIVMNGVAVSSPAHLFCELAGLLSLEDLICAGDYLLWYRQPKASPKELRQALTRYEGRLGRAKLEEALPELSDRADSPPESKIRFRLRRAGLPELAINPLIYDPSGIFLAMPDLAFIRYKMVLDYEGDHHRSSKEQWRKDLKRVPRLEDAGWHSTRISADDIRDSTELIDRLKRLLRARGWTG